MINITIDGHSGCGKSSTAKEVARRLDYLYLDTGAMYRAVTLAIIRGGIDTSDLASVNKLLDSLEIRFVRNGEAGENITTMLNDEDIEFQIRSMEVSERVSEVSKIASVREQLVKWQRKMSEVKGVVMEGRDVGTVIMPDAELKIFMTADLKVRAERRMKQMELNGLVANFDEIQHNLKERDRIDSSRGIAPLRKATGAIEIDTTHLSPDNQVEKILDLARDLTKN